ncbi:MAG: hypothetical protein JTT16_00980, partial [Candidatus Brockarchaeota archaeon]|nr:hypothetical protein [Candidatus Brockarchaeota archaeon]
MDKVKVGIVGCGNIAEAHLKALSTNSSAELVAFCDCGFALPVASFAMRASCREFKLVTNASLV